MFHNQKHVSATWRIHVISCKAGERKTCQWFSEEKKKIKKVSSSPSCSVTLHISVFVKCHLRVCDPVKAADQFTLEANPGKLQLNGS